MLDDLNLMARHVDLRIKVIFGLIFLCTLSSSLYFFQSPDWERLVVLLLQIAGVQVCFLRLKKNAQMKHELLIKKRALERLQAIHNELLLQEHEEGEK